MNQFERWFADKGDETHRLNYDLNEESIVFDVGGYRGDFAYNIHERYKSTVYIFEPVTKFYDVIVERFRGNDNIKIYNYGLSEVDSETEISLEGDSSSTHKKGGGNTEVIRLRKMSTVMDELNIDKIDLIKINIEGGEFPLLHHCVTHKLTPKLKNIQVQFHSFILYAEQKRDALRKKLKESHYITYDYPFVWENWRLSE